MSNHIVSTVTVTRPNTSVDFKTIYPAMPNGQFSDYLKANYLDTGKILSRTESVSDDNLKLIITTVWKDDAARSEHQNDSVVKAQFENLLNYRKSNGITTEWNSKEYDSENKIIRDWSGSF